MEDGDCGVHIESITPTFVHAAFKNQAALGSGGGDI